MGNRLNSKIKSLTHHKNSINKVWNSSSYQEYVAHFEICFYNIDKLIVLKSKS